MRRDIIRRYLSYKQHAAKHQEPTTPPRAPPRPPPPTVCTKDAPLRNDVPAHDFPVRAPVAYTRRAGRTMYSPISGREHRDGFQVDVTFPALTLGLRDERWVFEECETSLGLSRSW
ncbi:hypothetical protein M405DRAFT_812047 [Rhizopogon salebrosus TDB-379]|nr:hypothetical protein M405DRAFT_812047 [Rhizopogon salebrosus TDB-379]